MAEFTLTERTEPFTLEEVFDFIDDTHIGKMDACELKSRIVDVVLDSEDRVIDEFAEKLKDSLAHNYRHLLNVDTDGFEWLTTDAVRTHIDEIAEHMKKGV